MKTFPHVCGTTQTSFFSIVSGEFRLCLTSSPEETYCIRQMVAEKSSKTHYMQLISDTDPNITCCDCCIDWKHHALPCKHLLAVLLHSEQWSGWDSLPEFYRNVPQFNLDPNIVESAPQQVENATAATTNVPIAQEGDLPSDHIGIQHSDIQSVVDETKASVTSLQSQNLVSCSG